MSHLAKCLLSCSTDGNVDLVTVCVLGSNCSDMAVQLGNELNIDVCVFQESLFYSVSCG